MNNERVKIKIDPERFEIKWMDPATLQPNPRNHRKHPERQRQVLETALQEEGWIDPVIFNKRTARIVDGHLRVEEAIAFGIEKVPVIEIDVDECKRKNSNETPISFCGFLVVGVRAKMYGEMEDIRTSICHQPTGPESRS